MFSLPVSKGLSSSVRGNRNRDFCRSLAFFPSPMRGVTLTANLQIPYVSQFQTPRKQFATVDVMVKLQVLILLLSQDALWSPINESRGETTGSLGFGRSFGWKLNTRQQYELQDGKSVTSRITLANKQMYHEHL